LRHRSSVILLSAIAAGLGFKLLQGNPQQTATTAAANPVTVLVWMGVKASAPEDWSGSASISGGKLLAVEGRHFSEGDEVKPGNQWQAKTRADQVAPYADIHYTEMRPGSTPEVLHHPVGVYLRADAPSTARISVQTRQGNFEVALSDLKLHPVSVLQGKALVMRVPAEERLTDSNYEDDEPSIAMLPEGGVAVAWVGYKGEADRVFLRTRAANAAWSPAQEVTEKRGDIFKTSLAATPEGAVWVFWSERDQQRWFLWGRQWRGGSWSKAERISGEGSATFHRAAASRNGTVHVVWQSFRGSHSDIYLRSWQNGAWQNEVRLSDSPANDWEPAVAAAPDGTAHVAWDSYDKGNYDIHYRSVKEGRVSELSRVTDGPRFQAHVSIAVDPQGRPWLAWNESGVSWGKDQGFLVPTPLATPLHQERWLKVVMREGNQWQEAWPLLDTSLPAPMRRNAEHPHLVFSPGGALTLVFRHWTRRLSRSIGSVIVWENYATVYNGQSWTPPRPLPNSGSWIEKLPALAGDDSGNLWAAWMSDNRPFSTMVPGNADIYAARLDSPGPIEGEILKRSFVDSSEEVIPVHTNDAEDVKAIRAAVIESEGKKYRIFRGDMHRHTDISQDFKYDGSLFEVYRYALDAAGFDYIVPTDHQAGYDQEYSWWQGQKYVDLFLTPGQFVPLFGYERSLRYPNGHRNIVWAKRGVRTLPIPPEEAAGREGAKKLFAHLRETGGISMPHSSATDQGTDWRDNDPQVEPLMEIYQGYRTSYEYEGAPRAATTLNPHAQKSGWQPSGFWWNALDKGYRIGVQSSSDHWSTHISYACLLVEGTTREHLLDAIRKRHAYAATDNIILDFRAQAGGKEFLMGDDFQSASAPVLVVGVTGTNAIKQVDIVRDKSFIYTTRPQTKSIRFSFTDTGKGAGQSWYYVRVLQEDGQLAWSSPIWIRN
jgi:hypothetical protein